MKGLAVVAALLAGCATDAPPSPREGAQIEALRALHECALAVGDAERAAALGAELRAAAATDSPAGARTIPAPTPTGSAQGLTLAVHARTYEDLRRRAEARRADLSRAGRSAEAETTAATVARAETLARAGDFPAASDLLRQALAFPRP